MILEVYIHITYSQIIIFFFFFYYNNQIYLPTGNLFLVIISPEQIFLIG